MTARSQKKPAEQNFNVNFSGVVSTDLPTGQKSPRELALKKIPIYLKWGTQIPGDPFWKAKGFFGGYAVTKARAEFLKYNVNFENSEKVIYGTE